MATITITIAGPAASGRSFLKHQIAALLAGKFGLDVKVEEPELNTKGVMRRLYEPQEFIQAMNEKGTKIVLEEKQLLRQAIQDAGINKTIIKDGRKK